MTSEDVKGQLFSAIVQTTKDIGLFTSACDECLGKSLLFIKHGLIVDVNVQCVF